MRVTVCELPHDPTALRGAWEALCEHTSRESSELVLLPELAMMDPVWTTERFDLARWNTAERLCDNWLTRVAELRAAHVVGTRPIAIGGRLFNEGYLATSDGVTPLRRKYFLPDQPGAWESNWFDRGDARFFGYRAGELSFGLNICTELWALESYAVYARSGVQAILAPRATSSNTMAKWLAVGVVAAVRSGAFCLSSNRVDPTGACGGVGWIISPDGELLATTSRDAPFATVDIDPALSTSARTSYPRYVFG